MRRRRKASRPRCLMSISTRRPTRLRAWPRSNPISRGFDMTSLVDANIWLPSPLRGGVGGGGPPDKSFRWHPPPQPSPARGEGANGSLLRCHWSTRTYGSPPPCGEGLGVGVHPTSLSGGTPHPNPPPQGGRE